MFKRIHIVVNLRYVTDLPFACFVMRQDDVSFGYGPRVENRQMRLIAFFCFIQQKPVDIFFNYIPVDNNRIKTLPRIA